MMYRAPHERKIYRKVEHIKIKYFENATYYYIVFFLMVALILAEREFGIQRRAFEMIQQCWTELQ